MNGDVDDVQRAVRSIWETRSDRYSAERSTMDVKPTKVEMSFIGG